LLDQLSSYRDRPTDAEVSPIDADDVRALLGVARSERVLELAGALVDGDAGRGLALINAAFEAGEDPRQVNRQLVALLRAIMFQTAAGSPGPDLEINRLAERFSLEEISRHAARFSEIDYRIRHASLPQLPLEIAFVQATLDKNSRRESAPPPIPLRNSQAAAPVAPPPIDRPVQSASPPRAVRENPDSPPPVETPPRSGHAAPKIDAAPAVAAAPADGAITVDMLHDLWPKIRLDIKARDRRIEALLSSCDPATVNGNEITLVTSYKFHWEKMNEDASRHLVESVIGRLVNQAVSVSTEIRGSNGSSANGGAAAPNGPLTPAGASVAATEEPVTGHERSEAEQTVIDAARNIFDAEELTPQS
jgi:DNA polymerase III gamma/tau subunit